MITHIKGFIFFNYLKMRSEAVNCYRLMLPF